MAKNLAHIANLAFNRPVALEPGYARVFYSVLADKMGIGKLIDGITGEELLTEDMQQEAANYRTSNKQNIDDHRPYFYNLVDGIAILPVSGTLAHKYGSIKPYSGMTGYDGILKRLEFAMNDPSVRGVLMDFDTPGGQVAGCFDTTDMIARYSKIKPIWSLGHDMHCSGGQALSSACSRRLITQTGVAGSVGVVMAHTNIQQMLENNGTEITLIHSGAHKVDGNPYEKLPDTVRDKFQAEINQTRQMFAQKVADNIGMDVQQVLDTEAALYTGQEAVDVGFADELVNGADAVDVMIEHLNAQGKTLVNMGATMTVNKEKGAAAPNADAGNQPEVTEQPESQAASPLDETTVATNERNRVLGILGCDEAQGREAMAHKLAGMPTMTVEGAKELLAVAPKADSANANTDAASQAIEALATEHGQSLQSEQADSEESDDDKQVAALVASYSA